MSEIEEDGATGPDSEEIFKLGEELRSSGAFFDAETERAYLGSTLRMLRQSHELTMDQLSLLTKAVDPERAGVSRVAISRYETGASYPGYRELKLLAFSLRTPISSLVYPRVDPLARPQSIDAAVHKIVVDTLVAYGFIQDETPRFDGAIHNELVSKVRTMPKSKP